MHGLLVARWWENCQCSWHRCWERIGESSLRGSVRNRAITMLPTGLHRSLQNRDDPFLPVPGGCALLLSRGTRLICLCSNHHFRSITVPHIQHYLSVPEGPSKAIKRGSHFSLCLPGSASCWPIGLGKLGGFWLTLWLERDWLVLLGGVAWVRMTRGPIKTAWANFGFFHNPMCSPKDWGRTYS